MRWIALLIVTIGLLLLVACEEGDEARPTRARTVEVDRPLHSDDTILRMVAEAVCPRQPTFVQQALTDAVTLRYLGDGIWRVQGRVTLQGQVYTVTWEVDERTRYAAPQNDAALVFHAAAEVGNRC